MMNYAYNDFTIGKEVKVKPGRKSSQGYKFEYYIQPFKVLDKVDYGVKKYCELVIEDDGGVKFTVWSDAFLPNNEEFEFKIHW